MFKSLFVPVIVSGLVVSAFGQPKEFHDDFTAVATYDSDSFEAGCPGVGGSLTKYTLVEPITGDIYNSRAVSGNGRLLFSNRAVYNGIITRFDMIIVGAVDFIQCGMPGVPNYAFTDADICVLGAVRFDAFDLHNDAGGYGPDDKAGRADVDDDCDGTTDEPDESPVHNNCGSVPSYGPPYSDGGKASCSNAPSDGLPGIGGVDDDADGTVDEYDELGTGNDSDDTGGRQYWYVSVKGNLEDTSYVTLNMDPSTLGGWACNLTQFVDAQETAIEESNEIVGGYFTANVTYNYQLCASGTCYGAQVWAGTDMANPGETLGPVVNSLHTTTNDCLVSLVNHAENDHPQYQRSKKWLGSANFSDTFWVCEGDYYPSPSPDLDGDKDVDGFDFLTFSNCYNGSNRLPLAACANRRSDLDKDGDVDGFDFLTFSNCYNGSNRRPLSACMPHNLTACP